MQKIKDPAIAKLVEEFEQESAQTAAYYDRKFRRTLNRQLWKASKAPPVAAVRPNQRPRTVAQLCQGLLVHAQEWAIQQLLPELDRNQRELALPDEDAVLVIDGAYSSLPISHRKHRKRNKMDGRSPRSGSPTAV